MPSGSPHPFNPDPAIGWEDVALLQEARARTQSLLESLLAQSQDLHSHRAVDAAEKWADACQGFAGAIEAARQTLEGIDGALMIASQSADIPSKVTADSSPPANSGQ